jgi:hypothetical protein
LQEQGVARAIQVSALVMTGSRLSSGHMRKCRATSAIVVMIVCALFCAPASAYDRDKSDVVVLRNGNYLTGDILSLEYGTLSLKTDQMGTLRIEWPAVRSVSSKFAFAVERIGGAKYYGVITTSDDGSTMLVTGQDGVVQVKIDEVERLSRYSLSFWNRISGNLAVGFTYTKANDTTVGSINLDADYRSTAVESSLSFSSNTTKTHDGGDSYRALLSSSVMFLRQSRNFWGLVGPTGRRRRAWAALSGEVLYGGNRLRGSRGRPGVDHFKPKTADQRRGATGSGMARVQVFRSGNLVVAGCFTLSKPHGERSLPRQRQPEPDP